MLLESDYRDRLVAKLRKEGISDPTVLKALKDVPREQFTGDGSSRAKAYADIPLPIECGQVISQPFIVAYMTQVLDVDAGHDVLEIGTGSGYQTAILAKLARHVYTIERHRELHRLAVKRLQKLHLHNITAIVGDGAKGWPGVKAFDRIIVTAAPLRVPSALVDQLTDGGRLVIPIGKRGQQNLYLITKALGHEHVKKLIAVQFVPLLSDP